MKLSVDFAFEGFRIIRQRPQVILFWGIVSLIVYAANAAILYTIAGTAVQDLQAASQSQDTARILAAFSKLGPAYALVIPIGILHNAVISCAVFRNAAGNPGAFGGVRFGVDELRLIGVNILFFLIMLGLYIGFILVGAVVITIMGVLAAATSQVVGTILMVLAGVALFGAFFWVVARLSLAPVQSFTERRVIMFGSWKLTKGSSLTLIIGYVIAAVLAILVALLCLGIFMAALAILKSGDLMGVARIMQSGPDVGAILGNPVLLTYVVIMNLIVMPLLTAIFLGAPAAAYRQLAGGKVSAANIF